MKEADHRAFPATLGFEENFPDGLRVMALDSNRACLKILIAMLRKCSFTVVAAERSAQKAQKKLISGSAPCDIVVTELKRFDMDIFQFLRSASQRGIPVVVLSAWEDKDMISAAIIKGGVAQYMRKPANLTSTKSIWTHVYRAKLCACINGSPNNGINTISNGDGLPRSPCPTADNAPTEAAHLAETYNHAVEERMNEAHKDDTHTGSMLYSTNNREERVEKEEVGGDEVQNLAPKMKPRLVWGAHLQSRFSSVICNLGGADNAKPKKIWELMGEPELTRENIASHLQKHRLNIRKQVAEAHLGGAVASLQQSGNPTTPNPNHNAVASPNLQVHPDQTAALYNQPYHPTMPVQLPMWTDNLVAIQPSFPLEMGGDTRMNNPQANWLGMEGQDTFGNPYNDPFQPNAPSSNPIWEAFNQQFIDYDPVLDFENDSAGAYQPVLDFGNNTAGGLEVPSISTGIVDMMQHGGASLYPVANGTLPGYTWAHDAPSAHNFIEFAAAGSSAMVSGPVHQDANISSALDTPSGTFST
ncbi:two-component response regulator ORR21-like [Punica granatum]|uniref:Two-component response regulator ORR21-like n=1 Tax=Punica granatum TaxID=22663 RepID=A0A6P8CUC3_PUNGR|nr:two-component response regulator ORR21-like [Punica granatum]